MYVARGATGRTSSNLYTVNTATGVCTSLGSIPYAMTGLAFDPTNDGVLYGVTTGNSTSHPRWLVSVDPTTGAGTPIASLGVAVSDLAFDSTGQLYGIFPGSPVHLKKINKLTGAITDVGSTGIGPGAGNALGINRSNAAYFGESDELYSISLASAAIVDIGPTGIGGGASQNAQDFDDSGVLWIVATTGPGVSKIYTCNLSTGAATLVSTLNVNDMDALAWYVPPPTPIVGTPSRYPLWRVVVADLEGATITTLDKLASNRFVQPNLNAPLESSGTVPSDSPEINILHTDDFPFLAEGVRQLYWFRREWDDIVDTSCTLGGHGYYTIRASTLLLQITDEANAGDARSRFTAWDPWQYLFYRPIYIDDGASGNKLIPQKGHTYDAAWTMDEVVIDILTRMSNVVDVAGPPLASQFAFTDWGWSSFYDTTCTGSVIETCATSADGWHIEPGTSIGQALQDICTAGYMDIVFLPIYDPVNRPGILCELSIYAQSSDPDSGAGTRNYAAQFAWDAPGRSTVGFTDLFDGTQRANKVQYRNGQAGPLVPVQRDATSIARYGEYWAEQTFPAQTQAIAVEAIAEEQLVLRKTYKQTLTINPAPEFSPEPFVDYYIGDRVPIFIGKAQRGTYQLGDNSPRQPLPPGYQGSVPVPDPATLVWQRIYGIPVDIDDNGVETVRELLVGPIGPPV